MSENIIKEDYWKEVDEISKKIIDEAGINPKKQHELINEYVLANEWVNDLIGCLDILRFTANLTEVDSSEEEVKGIKDYLHKSAFWAFYGDIADKIQELEHDNK